MSKADAAHPDHGFPAQAFTFLRDFARFAGGAGVRAAVLAVVAAAFEGVGLVLLVPLLSIVTANDATPGWLHRNALHLLDLAGAQTRNARLAVLLGVFVVLLVVRALAVARRDAALGLLQLEFVEQIRSRVAQKLAAAPWPLVSRLQHARVTHLMSGDIQRIGAATNFMVQLLAGLVLIAAQVAIAFALAPALTGIAVVLIALGAGVSFVMLGHAHRLGTQLSRAGIALMHETTQFLGGLKLAAGQNRQADFVSEFAATLSALKRRQFDFILRQSRSRLAATVLSGLIGALIAFIGLTVLDMPPAILIAMLLIFARISAPAVQISQAAQQFVNALPAYAEVRSLENDLSAPNGRQPSPAAGPSVIAPGQIVFRNVSFAYSGARGALSDVSLTIAPGSFVGVSGPTGAGKTTFADLLIGLLEPQSGDISVGGTPLRGGAAAGWRDHISYVAQDPYLFRDTIRRNLLWANPRAVEKDLWNALAVAGAADLVSSMELGLDTVLGERGTLVSGGERQRLCLARAVLRRPWLYVFDEATSAIDVAGERKILKSIVSLDPRPTIVMIAHRDESLALCERILRLQDGKIVVDEAGLVRA